ncbi:hypothetical protein [Chryseobacterium timonianum]|uniref:hypothetical protein n=1 Tax=Chryseobacterium timonianum TaxID=1805473 RepID=UPI001F4B2E2F|nr:hypothetical protein [Chryseobacterium timonianum]
MELAIAGGASGIFASATTAGTSMSWNPIGWIILAVVAIAAIWYFWDDICDFFSTVGNAIADVAKVVWEFVTAPPVTAPPPTVDEELPKPVPPPVDIPIDEPITVPIAPPISVPQTKPRTRRREKDIYNVYDLHVGTPGLMRNYTYGAGFVNQFMMSGAIWKYGLTSFKSVYARYLVIFQLYHGDKDEYILNSLTSGKLLPKEWYVQNVNYATANAEEVSLIDAYVATHGKFPAGNTFRG